MYFLVDNDRKIIFGWTYKCGCSHIKKIFWFLQNNNIHNKIHTDDDVMFLPNDIKNYTTILFSRNPYKRLVSGFLNKYSSDGQYRHLWKKETITFSEFVKELILPQWSKMVDVPHFLQQTNGMFDKKTLYKSKKIRHFDIENIDYAYIEMLYKKKIPKELLNSKNERTRKEMDFQGKVYDLDVSVYEKYNVPLCSFFNREIKEKVYAFYKDDFLYFQENGIVYEPETYTTVPKAIQYVPNLMNLKIYPTKKDTKKDTNVTSQESYESNIDSHSIESVLSFPKTNSKARMLAFPEWNTKLQQSYESNIGSHSIEPVLAFPKTNSKARMLAFPEWNTKLQQSYESNIDSHSIETALSYTKTNSKARILAFPEWNTSVPNYIQNVPTMIDLKANTSRKDSKLKLLYENRVDYQSKNTAVPTMNTIVEIQQYPVLDNTVEILPYPVLDTDVPKPIPTGTETNPIKKDTKLKMLYENSSDYDAEIIAFLESNTCATKAVPNLMEPKIPPSRKDSKFKISYDNGVDYDAEIKAFLESKSTVPAYPIQKVSNRMTSRRNGRVWRK